MQPNRQTGLVIGIGLVVAMIAVAALVEYREIGRLHDDARWVAHTHEVLGALEQLVSTVKDAETGAGVPADWRRGIPRALPTRGRGDRRAGARARSGRGRQPGAGRGHSAAEGAVGGENPPPGRKHRAAADRGSRGGRHGGQVGRRPGDDAADSSARLRDETARARAAGAAHRGQPAELSPRAVEHAGVGGARLVGRGRVRVAIAAPFDQPVAGRGGRHRAARAAAGHAGEHR